LLSHLGKQVLQVRGCHRWEQRSKESASVVRVATSSLVAAAERKAQSAAPLPPSVVTQTRFFPGEFFEIEKGHGTDHCGTQRRSGSACSPGELGGRSLSDMAGGRGAGRWRQHKMLGKRTVRPRVKSIHSETVDNDFCVPAKNVTSVTLRFVVAN
jgi:hypothetical protein